MHTGGKFALKTAPQRSLVPGIKKSFKLSHHQILEVLPWGGLLFLPGAALLSIAQRRLREVKQLAWIDQLGRPNQEAGVGGAHQLRTCSVFYNQSHTQVDPSGPTASHSLIKTEQTSHLPCKVAIRECRVHKHNKHRFCASDQGRTRVRLSRHLGHSIERGPCSQEHLVTWEGAPL